MTPLHAWAVSVQALRTLAAQAEVPTHWFAWTINLTEVSVLERCGLTEPPYTDTLSRVTVLDLEAAALTKWAIQCLDLEIRPVIVLGEGEHLPKLSFDEEELEDEVLTIRVSQHLPASVATVLDGLSHPDEFIEEGKVEIVLEGYPSLLKAIKHAI